MSPEQVRAKELDARTDLFSFGVVLCEMSTASPFRGESIGVIFKAILDGTPAVRLNPDLPAELERIIAKCLEKDRNLRYQHASDLRSDLRRLKRDTESGRLAATIPGRGAPTFQRRSEQAALRLPCRNPHGPAGRVGRPLSVASALSSSRGSFYFYLRPLPPPIVSGYISVTHSGTQKDLVGTDGARLYFNQYAPLGLDIAQVSVTGGEVARVPVPTPGMGLFAVSPDGTALLIAPAFNKRLPILSVRRAALW